jgi:L-serine deaminase
MASANDQEINERAIRRLKSVTEKFSASTVAKRATALERLLASTNPDQAATDQHVRSFFEAARSHVASSGGRVATEMVRGQIGKAPATKKAATTKKTAKKKATTTKKIAKKLSRSKTKSSYNTQIFKCWDDYQTCCQTGNRKVCASLAAICISKQLAWAGAAVKLAFSLAAH